MSELYEMLQRLTLVCTDPSSKFHNCRGFADHWVRDKPDSILFTSTENVFGSEELSKDQFAVTGDSISHLERQIQELKRQHKMIQHLHLKINP